MDDVNLSWRITQRFQVGQSDTSFNQMIMSYQSPVNSHGADMDPNPFKTWSKTQERIKDMNQFWIWKRVEQICKDIEWWDSEWWMAEIHLPQNSFNRSKLCWSLSLRVHLGWLCWDDKSLPQMNHYQPMFITIPSAFSRGKGEGIQEEKSDREGGIL